MAGTAMDDASHPTTLAGLLLRSAERRPDHEALVFPTERFTYASLRDGALRSACSLAALGVARGDHVGLLMPNCPDFVLAFFGAQLLGAVVVPVNTRFRSRELGYVFENAELKVLLTSDIVDDHVDFVERIADSLPGLEGADPERLAVPAAPRLEAIVLLGEREAPGMVTRTRFDELGVALVDEDVLIPNDGISPDEVALMLYTSGTTAEPKGCLITHDAAIHAWTTAADRLRITPDDRVWDPLPLFHMSCLGPLIFTTAMGGTLITTTHFAPGRRPRADRAGAGDLALLRLPADHDGAPHGPELRLARPLSRARPAQRRAARHHAAHPGGVRRRGQRRRALRHDRDERRDHVQRVGRDPRRAGRDPRGAAPRDRGQGRRPGDGRRAAAGRAGGAARARARSLPRVPPRPRADRRRSPGRLAPLGRPRRGRRARARHVPRPSQGHAQGRRRERRARGDRVATSRRTPR